MGNPEFKKRYILAHPEFNKSNDVLGNPTYDRHGAFVDAYETFEAAIYGALHHMCNSAIKINSLNIHAVIYSIEDDFGHNVCLELDFITIYEQYINFLKALSELPKDAPLAIRFNSPLYLAIFFLQIDNNEWDESAKGDMDKCVAHNKDRYWGGEIGEETNSSGFPFELMQKEIKDSYADWLGKT